MDTNPDIIIVGAGNAGCVLASRLSEISSKRVLLLEAGGDHAANPALAVPAGARALWPDPKINWAYKTVPQEFYGGRSLVHHRGKGLGGTTLVNLNCMTFPDKHSFDNFGLIGNPGWSYSTVQPYLRKFHTFHEPSDEAREHLGLDYLDPKTHGTSGPVQVSFGNYHTQPFNAAWPATFAALGHKSKVDPCTGEALGAVSAPGTISPGTCSRSWAAGAYLSPEVKQRPNLEIITNAHVEKVILNDAIVEGVRYKDANGQVHTVKAKEVVLCGGVFNSPQLLELSGIGSKDILEKFDIKTIVDLPGVGENFQDHPIISMSFEATIETFDALRDPAKMGEAFKQYQESGSGPISSGIYCMSFMPWAACSSDSGLDNDKFGAILDQLVEESSNDPSLQKQYDLVRRIVMDPGASSIQYLAAPVQLDTDMTGASVPDEAGLAQYVTLYASLSHPFSRGSSHIKSSKSEDNPEIDPRYLSHPADFEILTRHLQYYDTITQTKPLADILKEGGRTIPADLDLKDSEYVRNKLLKTGYTTFHPSGTCAMMPRELGGVVDERLKVHGVSGLRVVDASVFPLIPRGNIQSSVYTLAERAADLIKEDLKVA